MWQILYHYLVGHDSHFPICISYFVYSCVKILFCFENVKTFFIPWIHRDTEWLSAFSALWPVSLEAVCSCVESPNQGRKVSSFSFDREGDWCFEGWSRLSPPRLTVDLCLMGWKPSSGKVWCLCISDPYPKIFKMVTRGQSPPNDLFYLAHLVFFKYLNLCSIF